MVEGSYKQSADDSTQMGYWRPNDGSPNHRIPINNRYLGGVSSYRGGLATFGAEVCVSDKVAEDCGVEKWWPVPESVASAHAKGMPL